jgi:hypothetical protein
MCFLTWETSGTPRNRLLFQLRPSALRTEEIGFSLWGTLSAADAVGSHGGGQSKSLRADIANWKKGLWATPQARDYRSGDNPDGPRANRKQQEGWSKNLNDQVKMWPTPKASLRGDCPSERERRTPDLHAAVKMWPTPQASDNKDRGNISNPAIQKRVENGKQVNLSMLVSEKSGQLNPAWVECLMGFPEGWTDIDGLPDKEQNNLIGSRQE